MPIGRAVRRRMSCAVRELLPVHVFQCQRLHDADSAARCDGRDEFRVGAGEHGATDEGYLDTGIARERGVEAAHRAGTGPMCKCTVAGATTWPLASEITDGNSWSASRLASGGWQCASAVRVPRAFLRKVIDRAVGMPRAVGGKPVSTASPLATSARVSSAIACTDPRALRTARRSHTPHFPHPDGT